MEPWSKDRHEGFKFVLSPGTQVREEDFGLLFYTMDGPRLYFLASGELLNTQFFEGKYTLRQWLEKISDDCYFPESKHAELLKRLLQLKQKGVIREY